jgi:hypothetical protein
MQIRARGPTDREVTLQTDWSLEEESAPAMPNPLTTFCRGGERQRGVMEGRRAGSSDRREHVTRGGTVRLSSGTRLLRISRHFDRVAVTRTNSGVSVQR